MIVVDENVTAPQRDLLTTWKIRFRQIGRDVGRVGMTDQDIVPLLRKIRPATLFTKDLGLYRRELRDPRFAIVCLAVNEDETASFVRRFLAHPRFRTHAMRLGRLFLVSSEAIRVWAPLASREGMVGWSSGT